MLINIHEKITRNKKQREIETWLMKDIEEEEFHDQLRSNDLGNSK